MYLGEVAFLVLRIIDPNNVQIILKDIEGALCPAVLNIQPKLNFYVEEDKHIYLISIKICFCL